MADRVVDEGKIRLTDETGGNTVPADRLVAVILGLQKTVRLIGALHDEVPVARKFRPTRALGEHYTLVAGVPEAGSYAQPVAVHDLRQETALDGFEGFDVLQEATRILDAVTRKDYDAVVRAVPSTRIRRHIFKTALDFLPSPEWKLELTAGDVRATVDDVSRSTVTQWLELDESEVPLDVVAELIEIKFEAHSITLKHPPTGRHLSALYELDIEEALFEGRRGMIELSGTMIVDDEGYPIEIVEVTAINIADLSPFTVAEATFGGVHLRLRTPLLLTPTLSPEGQQLYEVIDAELGLDSCGSTRAKVIEAVQEDLVFLWECYAIEDPDVLTEDAKALRLRLLGAIEQV